MFGTIMHVIIAEIVMLKGKNKLNFTYKPHILYILMCVLGIEREKVGIFSLST